MSRPGPLALLLIAACAPALAGCVVATVASTAVGVTAGVVGTTAKVATTTVGVAADVTGAAVRTVTGSGARQAKALATKNAAAAKVPPPKGQPPSN